MGRCASVQGHERRHRSTEAKEYQVPLSMSVSASAVGSPVIVASTLGPVQDTSRFFKVRIMAGSSLIPARLIPRPVLPYWTDARSPNVHLDSPSSGVLPVHLDDCEKERE